MTRRLAVFCIAVLVAVPAIAAPTCTPVNGRFEARTVAAGTGHCPAAAQFCTAGRVWGGIQGEYQFVISGLLPSATIGGMPTIFFFAGQSVVALKDGTSITGTDTGAIDLLGAGGFASLITYTTGSTGQIRLQGQFSAANGTTAGAYDGTLCRP